MSMFAMTLMREMIAAWKRLSAAGTGVLVQHAVHAIADAQVVFHRFEVDVGGAFLERFPDDLVDELDDAGFLVAAFEIFLRVFRGRQRS